MYEWNGTEALVPPFRLFEFHSYLIRVQAHKVVFLGALLEKVQGGWFLETPFAVGQTEIEWWDEKGHYRESICIDPDPNKIDEREQWEQMLADIAHWNGALLGTTGVRLGSVLFGEAYNVLCVEAILCLIRQFCDRIGSMDSWLKEVETDEPVNLQMIQPLELLQYQSDIMVQQWIRADGVQSFYVNISKQQVQEAHRELHQIRCWILQVQEVLEHVIGELRSSTGNVWRDSRAQELSHLYNRLDESLRRPPLYNVVLKYPSTETVVTSVNVEFVRTQMMVQQILSPRFSIESGQFPVSGRNSFGIYEIWCFQQIIDCCTVVCQSEPIAQSKNSLQWGGTILWKIGREELHLHYNPRFVAYWEHSKNTTRPYSLVGEQRPDFVLQHKDRWLILDAKYRSTRILHVFTGFL